MTRQYETAILFEPELPEEQRKDFLAKLAGVVATYKGEVLKQDDWGTRKLAYTIGKRQNAYYTFLVYTGERGVVEEIERNLKIFDGAIRFMTTRSEGVIKAKPAAQETAAEGPAPAGEVPPQTPPPPAG